MSHGIWEIIGEIGAELHPNRVNLIANKIAKFDSVDDFMLGHQDSCPYKLIL